MSTTLRRQLRKTKSSFNPCYSVIKHLKMENEENNLNILEKTSIFIRTKLAVPEKFKHIDIELEEKIHLKNTVKNIKTCESQSPDRSCSGLQNNFVNENIPKRGLSKIGEASSGKGRPSSEVKTSKNIEPRK